MEIGRKNIGSREDFASLKMKESVEEVASLFNANIISLYANENDPRVSKSGKTELMCEGVWILGVISLKQNNGI